MTHMPGTPIAKGNPRRSSPGVEEVQGGTTLTWDLESLHHSNLLSNLLFFFFSLPRLHSLSVKRQHLPA